jgi:hypothetical protein
MDNLQNSSISGELLAALAEVVSEKIDELGATASHAEFTLGYIPKDTPEDQLPLPGDRIPEVIIRIRQA